MLGLRFGSAQSAPTAGSGFRYLRLQFVNATTDINVMGAYAGNRFEFVTSDGVLPTSRQTSATTPLVVTASSEYATPLYAGWNALSDSCSSWNTQSSPLDVNPWLQIDFGETINAEITGVQFISLAINTHEFKVFTSPTGEFLGEETLVGEKSGIVWTGGLAVQQFIF